MLTVEIAERTPTTCVVVVTGALDLASAGDLLTRTDQLIDNGHTRLLLDVSRVTFCDSAGLGALLRARARAAEAGGHVRLRDPGTAVNRVLEVSGLGWLFNR